MVHEFEKQRREAFEHGIVRMLLTRYRATKYESRLRAKGGQASEHQRLRLWCFMDLFPDFPLYLFSHTFSKLDRQLHAGCLLAPDSLLQTRLVRYWERHLGDSEAMDRWEWHGLAFPWPRSTAPMLLHDGMAADEGSCMILATSIGRLVIEPLAQVLKACEWEKTSSEDY